MEVTIKRVLDKSGPSPRITTTIETTKRLGPAAADAGGWVASTDDGTWGEAAAAPGPGPGGQGGPEGPVKTLWSSVSGQAFQAVQTKGRLGKVGRLQRADGPHVWVLYQQCTQNKGWLQTALVLSATATALLLVVMAVLGIIGMLPGLETPLQAALLLSVVATIVLARICSS